MEERKFVVPFFNGEGISLVRDEKGNPVLYGKKAAEEIIKPVRDLINANDKRRSA